MAAPSYATDLTDIYTDTDNFTIVGGGRVTASETDDYIQGNNCWSHDPFSSAIEGGVYDTVTAETITSGDAVYIWTKCDVAQTLATHAAGGVQALIGNATTALKCFYVAGSDDYQYGGWKCYPVDPTKTQSTSIGTPSGVWDHFGVRWNVPSSGASKGYPMKIDAIRHGRNLEVTAGDSTTPATWDAVAAYDATGTRQWGILQPTETGAALQGRLYWGTATTAVYSRDSNRAIVIVDTEWTDTDFTQIIFPHASNDVVWDNVGVLALGTNNRGIIDVTADGDITWTNSIFEGIDTTDLLSNSTFDGSKWLSTNEVVGAGASMVGCQILTPTVATSSYGLLWNVATDTDGLLDGMTFSKGTNAHHAIELGTNCPSEITLDGWTVTGFNAAHGNNDSVIYNNSGKAVTVNVLGATGTISYQNGTSATTSIVENPVTTSIHVIDVKTGLDLAGARVLVWCDSGGPYPSEDTVTVTSSGTTASVSHTAHGMSSGNIVWIENANEAPYNGRFTISNVSANGYDYTMDTSTTSPATGTILATLVLIDGLTNASGLITDTRTFSSNQPILGRVRKSTP